NKYNEEPVILSPKMVKFRNSVIHKGYIPNLKEALDFGEAVHTLIMKVIARLEVCEDNKLSNFYQTVLPQGKGYKWTVDESPLAICLNKKYKTPDIPKATRCTEFATILKKFGINGL
ncbi:hypothetical protein L1D50_18000, partial [Pseudoalteromonas sp. Isolate6]|uniref:hypothetical protein n=1 Tax=Pseudoalteromonas sp. Isolate6 TaxID=2908527 RepID=UPI001EFDF819